MPNIVIKPKRNTYSLRLIPGIIEAAREKGMDVNLFIENALCEALEVDRSEYVQEALRAAQGILEAHTKPRVDS
jgi:hypothetical protein